MTAWPGLRRRGESERRTDHIMQWSYRNGPHHDRWYGDDRLAHEYILLVVDNIAAAFNGDRLVLARAR